MPLSGSHPSSRGSSLTHACAGSGDIPVAVFHRAKRANPLCLPPAIDVALRALEFGDKNVAAPSAGVGATPVERGARGGEEEELTHGYSSRCRCAANASSILSAYFRRSYDPAAPAICWRDTRAHAVHCSANK